MTACRSLIFIRDALVPTFPESAITKPFPFNGYYDVDDAPEIEGKDWKFEVRGLVDNKKSWTLDELYKLPQVKQVTRQSASRAGVRSEAGPARRCAISSN